MPLLQIKDLLTFFSTARGEFAAVDRVTLDIKAGETLGLVGESGSGKSVTALSVLQLIPDPPGKIQSGSIVFNGKNLLLRTPLQMQEVRGRDISMIFQEPITCLNPVYTIGNQLTEAIHRHTSSTKKEAVERSVELLEKVGIPLSRKRMSEYPHQLSGGMRQRVMITMALLCNPKLLIADEPTTALDVTIQAQILDLLKKIREEFNMSILLITHDLGVVAEVAHRVMVMYAGRIVEQAEVVTLFRDPLHPYTRGLLSSIPSMDGVRSRLYAIPGNIPDPFRLPPGCRFSNRCQMVLPRCGKEEPPLLQAGEGRMVRCWLYQ